MNSIGRFAVLGLQLFFWTTVFAEPGVGPRIGYFKVELSLLELLGEQGASEVAPIFEAHDLIDWQLYVPESYNSARPAGAVVWVSPTPRGGSPRRWNQSLEDRNLIWIGANNSGNKVAVAKRMMLALLATRMLVRDYAIDAKRIYIAGFSGGGKTAGMISYSVPDVFRGGIYIGGAEAWKLVSPPPKLDLLRQNYHVFLTGTEDFNKRLTRRVYSTYKAQGVENSKLIVVKRLGHELPNARVFLQAIDYLDSQYEKKDLDESEGDVR